MNSKIILYSNGCPKCNILKNKLDEKGILYQLCDDIEVMKEKKLMSAPNLEVDGIIYDFNAALIWLKGE